jgi:glycosyltransferase 2 family protein
MTPNKRVGLRSVVIYTVSLSAALFLFYWLYRDVEIDEFRNQWAQTHIGWVGASMFLGVLAHLCRAARWSVLLSPLGYQVSLWRTFAAVLVGYFANLALPRAGELARCVSLQKGEQVRIDASIGTVITERTLDFVVLLTLIALTLVIELPRIEQIVGKNPFDANWSGGLGTKLGILIGLLVFGMVFVFVFLFFKNTWIDSPLFKKIRQFLQGIWAGLLTIKQLGRKQLFWYLFHTFAIWLLYYVMLYLLFFSIEPTQHLSWATVNLLVVMGGIGMVIPVQGGIGTYHFFTKITLMSYGILEADSIYFAFLAHTSQTVLVIVLGSLALALIALFPKK